MWVRKLDYKAYSLGSSFAPPIRTAGDGLRPIACWNWISGSNPAGQMNLSLVSVMFFSSRGLCDGPMPRAEESYRLWCVAVCDLETSRMRRSWSTLGCCYGERGERGNVSYLIVLLSHYCHISGLHHIVRCFLYTLLTNATSSDISHCVTTVPTS
jgi:hypothetical protein